MLVEVTKRYITIKAHIHGAPQEYDFKLKQFSLLVKPGSENVTIKAQIDGLIEQAQSVSKVFLLLLLDSFSATILGKR